MAHHHIPESSNENVADFIHRLEKTFHVAYIQDGMYNETWYHFLYTAQDVFKHEIMQSPAVSRLQAYKDCT